MIKNSFIFLPKIAQKKEKNIWRQGVKDWDSFINRDIKGISSRSKSYYDREIIKARKYLYEGHVEYFVDNLPSNETWRLYDFLKDDAVFLDIETSHISMNSYLTVLGIYDGIDTKIMIKDINLDIKRIKRELGKYKLLVTFNGASFDVPYLNKKYPGLIPNIPHMDLRHVCARLDLTGGLKQVEKSLNIERENKIVERLYGGDPLKLWRTFRATGEKYYLNLLVEYNEEDIINLKLIADKIIDKLKNETINF